MASMVIRHLTSLFNFELASDDPSMTDDSQLKHTIPSGLTPGELLRCYKEKEDQAKAGMPMPAAPAPAAPAQSQPSRKRKAEAP